MSIRAHDPAEANRQLLFLVISLVALSVVQLINYREIGRYSWPLYIASVLLLIYTVIGAWYGNPRAWAAIGYDGPPHIG